MRCQILFIVWIFVLGIGATATQRKFLEAIRLTSITVSAIDNEIQLRIKWNDTTRDTGSSYNVIVTPVNGSGCQSTSCAEYGIPRTIREVVVPRELTPYLEHKDCIIMPGCTYNIKIESSNGKASGYEILDIPYCVGDVCSCRHAQNLPKVNMSAEIISNHTVRLNWTISALAENNVTPEGSKTISEVYDALQLKGIYISIGQQTNPLLTWGGKHRPIEAKVYSLTSDNSTTLAMGFLQGYARFQTEQQLYPESRYQLRTHVIDNKKCPGPDTHLILQMQNPVEKVHLDNYSHSMIIVIFVVTSLFVCGAIISATICIRYKCRWQIKSTTLPRVFSNFEISMSPHAMEDNILYVDKDIEDAQLKGLADIFEVPHSALSIGTEIGVGAFGRVFKATAKNLLRMKGTTIVAVKQLKRNPTSEETEEFLSEINMLKGVGRHHNIVSFLGCCTIRAPYMMIMEFVGRGDLLDYLRTVRQRLSLNLLNQKYSTNRQSKTKERNLIQKNVKYIELKIATNSDLSFTSEDNTNEDNLRPSVTETMYTTLSGNHNSQAEDESFVFEYVLDHKELHNFALQIANGMKFLEEQQITHRDLAARNVLIDDRKTLKISDFGLSRHGIYTNTKTRKLPLRWLSIEAICDNLYSSKSDVWAFGVVLWEIGTLGASPYPTLSNSEIIPFLVSGRRLDKPEICTDQVYQLMLECWHDDPLERPSFADVYARLHPKSAYVDINSISDDYVFPPIQEKS